VGSTELAATLYLVRHAAHDRVGDTLCGRMPGVTLGAEGKRQAARVAERLARESVSAVFSSPLERAIETAEPIARKLNLSVQVSETLNEIDFGAWTGRRFDALAADPSWRAWNRVRSLTRPPGGEDFVAAQCRFVSFLKAVADERPGQGLVAVTHCDLIRAALCAFLNCRGVDDYRLFEIGPASVTTLVCWGNGWKVLGMNEAIAA
jgi:broad specificity phosphatase PhoE